MAAVFDGDPQPLYEVILDPDAEEYIRSRMCEALAMIALRGELDRDRAAAFSATPTMNCGRSGAASHGLAGKAPSQCSALAGFGQAGL
jgi:hypothetical protein